MTINYIWIGLFFFFGFSGNVMARHAEVERALDGASASADGTIATQYFIRTAITRQRPEVVFLFGVLSDAYRKNPHLPPEEANKLIHDFPVYFEARRDLFAKAGQGVDFAKLSANVLKSFIDPANLPSLIPDIRDLYRAHSIPDGSPDPRFKNLGEMFEFNVNQMRTGLLSESFPAKVNFLREKLRESANADVAQSLDFLVGQNLGLPFSVTDKHILALGDPAAIVIQNTKDVHELIAALRAKESSLTDQEFANYLAHEMGEKLAPELAMAVREQLEAQKAAPIVGNLRDKIAIFLGIGQALLPLVNDRATQRNLAGGMQIAQGVLELSKIAGVQAAAALAGTSAFWSASAATTSGLSLIVAGFSMMAQADQSDAMQAIFDFLVVLRKEMHERFDRVDLALRSLHILSTDIWADTSVNFEMVERALREMRSEGSFQIDVIMQHLGDVSEKLVQQEHLLRAGFSDQFWLDFRRARRNSEKSRYTLLPQNEADWNRTADDLAHFAINGATIEALTSTDESLEVSSVRDPFVHINLLFREFEKLVHPSGDERAAAPISNPVAWSTLAAAYQSHLDGADPEFLKHRLNTDNVELWRQAETVKNRMQEIDGYLRQPGTPFSKALTADAQTLSENYAKALESAINLRLRTSDTLPGTGEVVDMDRLLSLFATDVSFPDGDSSLQTTAPLVREIAKKYLLEHPAARAWLRSNFKDYIGINSAFRIKLSKPHWDFSASSAATKLRVEAGDNNNGVKLLKGYASLQCDFELVLENKLFPKMTVQYGTVNTAPQYMYFSYGLAHEKSEPVFYMDSAEVTDVVSSGKEFEAHQKGALYGSDLDASQIAALKAFGKVIKFETFRNGFWGGTFPLVQSPERSLKLHLDRFGKEAIEFHFYDYTNSTFLALVSLGNSVASNEARDQLRGAMWDRICGTETEAARDQNLPRLDELVASARNANGHASLLLNFVQIFSPESLLNNPALAKTYTELRDGPNGKPQKNILCNFARDQWFAESWEAPKKLETLLAPFATTLESNQRAEPSLINRVTDIQSALRTSAP